MIRLFLLGCIAFSICSFQLLPENDSNATKKRKTPYKTGEFIKWKVRYGFINAGFATLSLSEYEINNKKYYHAVGKGWSTGIVHAFFKIKDRYESYFDPVTKHPIRFIRKIDEGGHWKHREIEFDSYSKKVTVKDFKTKKTTSHTVTKDVQDMISSFYSLRETPLQQLSVGSEVTKNLFFDFEIFPFKIKILGKETIKTRFGYIDCLKIRPYVQHGGVFKEKESVTMWITNDSNLLPIQIKAQLVVGSLKADLYEYSGLSNEIKISREKKRRG